MGKSDFLFFFKCFVFVGAKVQANLEPMTLELFVELKADRFFVFVSMPKIAEQLTNLQFLTI